MEQKRRKRKRNGGRGKEKSKVLKRGSVRNDCESVGDNFEYSFKPETIQKMNQLYYNFVWTDERAKLLIDTYHSYLEHDANELRDFDSRERCLEELKTVFNVEEEDGENLEEENGKNHTLKAKAVHIIHYYSEKKATDDAITSKLDEFATTYLKKYEDEIKYGELKKILNEKWSKFKLLVQHEKFDYYRPLNAPPLARCATRLKGRSSTSTRFYWTDDLLQHLVQSYHLVLRSIKVGTLKPKRTDCLNHLKRSLGGVSFDTLESKLDVIFREEICQHVPCLYLRKRLGKGICIIYEEILKDAHRDVYKKETRTSSKSSSHNTSSTSSSIRSPYMLAAAEKRVERDRLAEAVRKLGFEGSDFALAICELSSDSMQHSFLVCQGAERVTFVEQCIKNQKWRSSQGS